MDFAIKKKENPEREHYAKKDFDVAIEFTRKIYKEFGSFIKSVVIFGGSVRRPEAGDIDVLIIVDDLSIEFTAEVVEAYRIITEKTVIETDPRLHITTLKFTNFWEYVRAGDPIAINILRDGVSIIDTGFFEPLQVLLRQGRIRPTQEAIWNYFAMAPRTLWNSKWHITQATLDLYWAVIDSAHASLMKLGEIPPTPEHVADLMEKVLVKKGLVSERYVHIMRTFYSLSRKITHREIKQITGAEYDTYVHMAEDFVNAMRKIIENKNKK
jgi:uncharacterized protein (UPF0332 family)